jgi:hypothetical protein
MGMSIVFDVESEKLWEDEDSKINDVKKIGLCGFITVNLDTLSELEKPSSPYEKASSPYEKDSSPYEKDSSPYEKDSSPYEKDSSPYEKDSSPYEENDMTSTKQMIVMIAAGSFISLVIIACVYWYVRSSSSVSTSNKVLNYNEYTPIYDRA